MAREDRVGRLEREAGPRRCEDCGGFVIWEELYPGGEVRYPFGPPCPTCGSGGTDGKPGKIVVDMTGSQDRPRRPGLDDSEDS